MENTIYKYGCCLLCLIAGAALVYAFGPKNIIISTGNTEE